MNTQTISLDVSKQPQVTEAVYIGQGDKSGTTLAVSVFDSGSPLSLSGYTTRFCMRLPDGESYYSVAGTSSGNVATFHIDESYAAAVVGTTDNAYVEVLSGSTVIASTSRFRVIVLEGAREGVDPGEQHISEIDEAVSNAAAATTAANSAANAADEAAAKAQKVVDDGFPLMTASQRGGAKLGDGLAISGEKLSAKTYFTNATNNGNTYQVLVIE